MTTLPPFTPNATCPKCGGGVRPLWFSATAKSRTATWDGEVADFGRLVDGEYLHLSCTTCGYAWPEAPMDAVYDTTPGYVRWVQKESE